MPQPQQHLHKFPIYNQPQPFTQHHHHVQHPKHQHLVTSKPSAVETPLPTSSSSPSSNSEVHHNQHGAVSFVNYSQLSKLPTPAALIATSAAPHQHHQQQHAYYHQQHSPLPQQFYADYKHLHPLTFAQIPTVYSAGASNYFPNHHQHHHQHQQQQHYAASAAQPYAQISKISSMPQPSPSTQVLSVSVVPTTLPQKVTANF
jgi:hypothetical protein